MVTETWIGTEIGSYKIVEAIGSGGTSVVYRAEHVRLGRPAALKLLGTGFGGSDFSERFLRESRLAASLQHPNIVPVYDAGEERGVLYIAMAYIAGSDLRELLEREGPLDLRRTLRIAGQIADALDTAHAAGLVHRDVKPANILVTEDDRALLTDFGAVKEVIGPGADTGGFLGTVDYAAPEQIENRDVSTRVDVYGLACVLWECLTGSPPFRRASEVETLYSHLHSPPPRLRSLRPDLPAPLEPVLSRGLAKSPLDRYPGCGDLLTAARAAGRPLRLHGQRLALAAAVLAAVAIAGIAAGGAIGWSLSDDPAQPSTAMVTTALTTTVNEFDGHALDAAAYALMRDKQYASALPYALSAVQALSGHGPSDPYEGYANDNLGNILLELGRCSEAVPYLERSSRLQPKSSVTRNRLRRARRCAGSG